MDRPSRAFYEGVNPKTIWNNCHRKAEASVVGRVQRLLRRCPLTLDEGYHRSYVGLVE